MLTDVASQVVVGRQGIYDRRLRVVGYELRLAAVHAPRGSTGDLGEAGCTILGTLSVGIERLVGERQLFVRADRALLADDNTLNLLPPNSVVIIGPQLAGDESVLAGCRRLAAQGHSVALEGAWWRFAGADLLAVASIVKIDLNLAGPAELAELDELCREHRVLMFAAGIETAAQREAAARAGADFLQGPAVGETTFESSSTLGAVNLDRLRAAADLLGGQLEFEQIESLLKAEPGLTYQVLQLASLGRPGETRRRVRTVREALVVAGSWRVQNWVAFLVTRTQACRGEEVVASLARARACELLAMTVAQSKDVAFTAGMVASFVDLLGIPADELARRLPLSEELHDAAFGTDSLLGRIVHDVAARMIKDPQTPMRSGLSSAEIDYALAGGFQWALDAAGVLAA